MLRSDIHAQQRGDILQEGVESATSALWLVNPTRETVTELVQTFRESNIDPPGSTPVRVFAAEQPLTALTDDFLLATQIAELVHTDQIRIRSLERIPHHELFVTERAVMSIVTGDSQVAGLTTTRDRFVQGTVQEYRERWRRADGFSLRTPPLSTLRETLADKLGPDTVTDFDTVLATLESMDRVEIDEVTLSLLIAANNEELLYDISRWGEDVKLASKATFSRTKNELEEAGFIDTEKVPIEVGRPRLRLLLADEMREEPIEAVTRQVRSEFA